MTENAPQQNQPRLLDASHLRDYVLFIIGIAFVISLYYIFSGLLINAPGHSPNPSGPPGPPQESGVMPSPPGQMNNMWPLWGQLVLPSLEGVALALIVVMILTLSLMTLRKKQYKLPSLPFLVTLGLVLIVLTNLVQGWSLGIEVTIGGANEIFWDIPKVVNPTVFISDYSSLQGGLSVHAQTQPPGAVLTIYFLNLLFQSPTLIAIGLSVIAGVFSAFFINGFYTRIFDKESAKYGAFLYLLLPAVQVYYLANIYAVIATLAAGSLYFYFHPNRMVRLVGILVTLFLGTFISFLFIYVPLLFLLFELFNSSSSSHEQDLTNRLKLVASSLGKLIVAGVGVVVVYALLYLGLGFNYVETFLYASSLENPSGFMLIANPAEYVVTRLQDILDILVFFGPVLSVLCYRGLKLMRESFSVDGGAPRAFNLVISSLVALLLLFLAGAPKKGETARICMFVLPLFLISVLYYLNKGEFSRLEKIKLLLLVFSQAVILQLFGLYVW